MSMKHSLKIIISFFVCVLAFGVFASCAFGSTPTNKESLNKIESRYSIDFPDDWKCLYKSKLQELSLGVGPVYFALRVTDENDVFFSAFNNDNYEPFEDIYVNYSEKINTIQKDMDEVAIPQDYRADFESEYLWKAIVIGRLYEDKKQGQSEYKTFVDIDALQSDYDLYKVHRLYMIFNVNTKILSLISE